MPAALVAASAAHLRLARAREWLARRKPAEQVLVVAPSFDAAHELLRETAAMLGASFGWQRATLGALAARIAQPRLMARGLVPVGRLASEAVAARVLDRLRPAGGLGRYAPVADLPGFARAVAGVLEELRMAGVEAAAADIVPELASFLTEQQAELERAGLADRPAVYRCAIDALRAGEAAAGVGHALLLLDLPLHTTLAAEFVQALAGRAPDLLATLPAGDPRSAHVLEQALAALEGVEVEREDLAGGPAGSLATLQSNLFETSRSAFANSPPSRPLDAQVRLFNAPGESRECVEIARRLLAFAREGMPFDRMAILLRSPEEYRPHLVEALERAKIPAHFARGAVLPDPAGRAFMALLACVGEGLSARRFAEYLSLGQVPDATPAGAPPEAPRASERWVAPDEELVPDAVARALEAGLAELGAAAASKEAGSGVGVEAPVRQGTLRAPRRWEQLLVDAAVIGGRERWERRLAGLDAELERGIGALEDPEDPARERQIRRLADLRSLRDYALPLLDSLAELPAAASWAEWLDALSALASRALRSPARVLSVLAELAPMAEVGPVSLAEVALVLSRRLLELAVPAAKSRYGKVFVAPVEAARGLCFDVVCVPGLAERLFPRKISEEPLLLDALRRQLGAGLETNSERVECERLALRIAVGAAQHSLLLSYPRFDLDQSRPRVPSFYALEALRAAEGQLPGFEELGSRAETEVQMRVGWPAPRRPEDAIDEAEHDLALLDGLLTQDEAESVGSARFLLDSNPHLGRSLRFRARRWLRRWTQADGLLAAPGATLAAGASEAMGAQGLSARSFSPTALQHYAVCPYRFFLHTVLRLAAREQPEPIDELNPLQRGSLVHDVQFEFFERLASGQRLPVSPEGFDQAGQILDDVIGDVAARHREELVPAIERVWEDGVASIRADLREWLRRASEDTSGFVPWRFELAFGLPGRLQRDPHSVEEPAALDGGLRLRGSIDLVERTSDGRVRVTDHKTGRVRLEPGDVIAGGSALQPVLYALAAEKLFPDDEVVAGRLYYCTSAGGFEERSVDLDERARASAAALTQIVDGALAEPFLPAAPAEGACRWCDYAEVCGPYEELRSGRKPATHPGLESLRRLRGMP